LTQHTNSFSLPVPIVLCLLGTLAAAVTAQGQEVKQAETAQVIEEILVTGEFRAVDINRLPASISVIGAEEMQLRAVQHLEDISGIVPNLNVTSGASRARYFQLRGIGERGQFEEPLNSSVGLLIDGVDFSGVGGVATLYDVSQVEVFRGPQGTRYGANALAGLISVRTNDPTESLDGNLRMEAGNYDSYGLSGAVSGPLTETISARLAANYYRSDGFADNNFTGDDDGNERDELMLRGKASWQVSETTELTAMLGRIEIDNGYDAFSLDNDRDTLSDQPGHDQHDATFGSIGVDWRSSDVFRIEALAAYADSNIGYGYDEDWVFVGFDPDEYSSFDSYDRDRRTATLEVKVASQADGRLFNDSTDWVVGVYALDSDVDLTRTYTFLPGPFDSDYEVDRYALFGQSETALSDRLNLTFGLRYEYHTSDYSDSNGVNFDPDDDLVGAKVALDYLLDDSTMVYASAAKGYKAGGFNTLGTLDPDLREFDPEDLYNLEIGVKGSWLGDTLTGRFSGFYMWRDDMQVESSVVRTRPDGSSEFIQFVGNASDGSNWGFEAEVEYQATDRLTLFANLGLLFTEYDGYVNSAGEDLDGRDQAQAPNYQFFAGADYRFGNGFFIHIEVEGKDDYYFSDNHDEQSDAYELINLAAGIERDSWTATAWGRNVTDEDYFVRGFFFGNDPRDFYTPKLYTQLGEPARYGLTVEWQL
jgi:outer membrane receptor protein involved in Fe transport